MEATKLVDQFNRFVPGNTTPRPWKVVDCIANDHRGYLTIQGPNGEKVADIFPFAGVGGVGLEQARMNAALIVSLANARN